MPTTRLSVSPLLPCFCTAPYSNNAFPFHFSFMEVSCHTLHSCLWSDFFLFPILFETVSTVRNHQQYGGHVCSIKNLSTRQYQYHVVTGNLFPMHGLPTWHWLHSQKRPLPPPVMRYVDPHPPRFVCTRIFRNDETAPSPYRIVLSVAL